MPKDKVHRRRPSFFSPYSIQPREQRHEQDVDTVFKKKRLVNVGGQGDCGFRALAAAMVDNIIAIDRMVHAKPHHELARANQEFCRKLLQRHIKIFPKYNELGDEGLLTPVARLQRMMSLKQGFIPDLAFTLRQAAVDEIVDHPEEYRGAFVDYVASEVEFTANDSVSKVQDAIDAETAPLAMRKITTWIDESAIAAVAKVFDVPVTVRVTEANKELPKPLHYGPAAATSAVTAAHEIEIRLQDSHYQPMLADTNFGKVAHETAFMQQAPVIPVQVLEPSLAEMIDKIKAEDKLMLEEFQDYKAHLIDLVQIGRLDKEKLLAIYIHGLNKPESSNSGYLQGRIREVGLEQGRIREVGLEHGNQDFFARAIKNAGSSLALTHSDPNDEFDKIIVKELVHAIARAMAATHDLSLDEVYAQIDGARPTL